MSFFGVGNPFASPVGQKIEQATDGALPSENWSLNMEICDIINSTPEGPKDAIKAIRKRLVQNTGKNFTIVMYTLTVLETCVKNCGKSFHVLVCNKEFISELIKIIGPKNDPPTAVQEKVLSLIQCWADAFQNQPELQGVVYVYNELRTKGIEFPMTDLDSMAPIFTPQRSVPDGAEPVVGSPQRTGTQQHSPTQQNQEQTGGSVILSESQTYKLHADLVVVDGNMTVMEDMLTELTTQPHTEHHESDIELLNELADTLKAMQNRMVELVGRLAGASPLTAELLQLNDRLNQLLLRHSRFISNRNAATGATPSAILGAAMGVPGTKMSPANNDDALIDLSDDVPDIAKLSVKDNQPDKSPSGSKDEFDMFAQSRNVTYENSKNGSSSYADNLEDQSTSSLASIANQRIAQGQTLPSGMDQREIDEISAWLAQEKATSEANGAQESVTSSDFDRFLASRAAAADNLPPAQPPRPPAPHADSPHRRVAKHQQDQRFAL